MYGGWRESEACVKANTVIILQKMDALVHDDSAVDMVEGPQRAQHAILPSAAVQGEAPSAATVESAWELVPFKWMDTSLQHIENRFKVVANGLLWELKRLESPQAQLDFVNDQVKKAHIPSVFLPCHARC